MNAGAKHLLNSLEWTMGIEATKKVSVQEVLHLTPATPGPTHGRRVHVFENAVVDTRLRAGTSNSRVWVGASSKEKQLDLGLARTCVGDP